MQARGLNTVKFVSPNSIVYAVMKVISSIFVRAHVYVFTGVGSGSIVNFLCHAGGWV